MNTDRPIIFLYGVGLCPLLVPAATAAAQDCRVAGMVTDPSATPIAGALVLVEQTGVAAETDADGRYCITEIESGTYHLMVTADGHHEQHSHPIAVDGSTVTIDIVLQPAFRSEIVVTGTRTERRLSEVPVRTEVVRRDTIERIEVVKGGGSALYGSGSVGGGVNIIPRQPTRSGGAFQLRPESIDGEDATSINGALDWGLPHRRQRPAVDGLRPCRGEPPRWKQV